MHIVYIIKTWWQTSNWIFFTPLFSYIYKGSLSEIIIFSTSFSYFASFHSPLLVHPQIMTSLCTSQVHNYLIIVSQQVIISSNSNTTVTNINDACIYLHFILLFCYTENALFLLAKVNYFTCILDPFQNLYFFLFLEY